MKHACRFTGHLPVCVECGASYLSEIQKDVMRRLTVPGGCIDFQVKVVATRGLFSIVTGTTGQEYRVLTKNLRSETSNILYYFVGKSGYVFSTRKDFLKKGGKDRYKYMGFTTDAGWPKKMNTGRLLHKPNPKIKKLRSKSKN